MTLVVSGSGNQINTQTCDKKKIGKSWKKVNEVFLYFLEIKHIKEVYKCVICLLSEHEKES